MPCNTLCLVNLDYQEEEHPAKYMGGSITDENHETGQIQAKGPSGEGQRPKWRRTKPPSGEG